MPIYYPQLTPALNEKLHRLTDEARKLELEHLMREAVKLPPREDPTFGFFGGSKTEGRKDLGL